MKRLQTSKSNLTVFTTCKPWRDDQVGAAQWNALHSWTLLDPRPEIVVYGNEFGSARMAELLKLAHRPDVERHRGGLPYISSLFAAAQAEATTPVLCYVNADIIMVRGLAKVALMVDEWAEEKSYMVVGRRLDVPALAGRVVDMTAGWRRKLMRFALASGEMHGPEALDWFMFRRGTLRDVPPFIMACTAWDNWMLMNAQRKGFETMDATEAVLAVHQADSLVQASNPLWAHNQQLWRAEQPKQREGVITSCDWLIDANLDIVSALA